MEIWCLCHLSAKASPDFTGLVEQNGTTPFGKGEETRWNSSYCSLLLEIFFLLNQRSDYTAGPEQQWGIVCWDKWELLFFTLVSEFLEDFHAFRGKDCSQHWPSPQTLGLGTGTFSHPLDSKLKTLWKSWKSSKVLAVVLLGTRLMFTELAASF